MVQKFLIDKHTDDLNEKQSGGIAILELPFPFCLSHVKTRKAFLLAVACCMLVFAW